LLAKFKKPCCCQPCCDPCGSGYYAAPATGCNGCGAAPVYSGAPAVMPKVGETIPAPAPPAGKPLPQGQTSIQIVPQQAPVLDATPTTTARPTTEIKEPF
jgi:hypothetical protein